MLFRYPHVSPNCRYVLKKCTLPINEHCDFVRCDNHKPSSKRWHLHPTPEDNRVLSHRSTSESFKQSFCPVLVKVSRLKFSHSSHSLVIHQRLHLLVSQLAGHIPSRTIDIQDGLSCVASTASYRDSLAIWSAQQSGGRPLDDGGVQANMLDGGRHMCPNGPGTVCRLLSLVEVVRCGW